jgi:hypothetical protein
MMENLSEQYRDSELEVSIAVFSVVKTFLILIEASYLIGYKFIIAPPAFIANRMPHIPYELRRPYGSNGKLIATAAMAMYRAAQR